VVIFLVFVLLATIVVKFWFLLGCAIDTRGSGWLIFLTFYRLFSRFLFPLSLLPQVPCRSSAAFQPMDFLGDGRLEESGVRFQ
jgi:hypothetical protein